MKKIFVILFLLLIGEKFSLNAQNNISDSAALRYHINTEIIPNNTQAVTAYRLNNILNGVVNVLSAYGVDSVWQSSGHLRYRKNKVSYDAGVLSGGASGYQLPYNGDSTYYLGGDSMLHKLSVTITGGDTTITDIVLDSTGQPQRLVLFGAGNNHIASNSYFNYDTTKHKLVVGNKNNGFGGGSVKFAVDGNSFLKGTVRIGNAYTFPATDGSANQVLKTNGSGVVAWAADNNSGGGGGSNDPDSLGGKAAAAYELVANKKTTITNSTTDYASTSAVTTTLATKLNITDTAIINAEIVQLRSAQALKLNISDTAAMLSAYATKINKNIDSIAAHNTRILNEAVARDNADIKTLAVTGTITKTITLTKGDLTTITGTFTDLNGGSGAGVTKAYGPLHITPGNDSIYLHFNVKAYGAVGDGVANDQAAVQAAINACYNAGGGIVYFPKGTYRIAGSLVTSGTNVGNPNSLLYIPSGTANSQGISIVLEAEQKPNQLFDGLPSQPAMLTQSGSVLYADPSAVSGTYPSLLGCDGTGGFFGQNYNISIEVKNLALLVKNRPGSGANMSPVNFKTVANATVHDNYLSIDTAGYLSSYPTAETFGIYLPETNNGTVVRAYNNVVVGFKYGIIASEHASGDGNEIVCCEYGLVAMPTNHGIHFDNLGIHWCKHSISGNVGTLPILTGATTTSLTIDNLNAEFYTGSVWYSTRYVVDDTLNTIHGNMKYHMVNGAFSKNGGVNFRCYDAADSTQWALTNGINFYYNPNAAMYQYFNTVNSHPTAFIWQYRGTSKWMFGEDVLGANKSYLSFRNMVLNSNQLELDTTGATRIGGDATSASTSYLNIDAGGATVNGNSFKVSGSAPFMHLNTTGTSQMAIMLEQSGTAKYQIGMGFAGSGSDFYLYDQANSKSRFAITSGVVTLGGDAYTSSGANAALKLGTSGTVTLPVTPSTNSETNPAILIRKSDGTVEQKTLSTLTSAVQALTDGATITMDCSLGYNGYVTLGGNRTLALSNVTAGKDITIVITQDGTGSRIITLPATSLVPNGFGSGTSITLSTGAGKVDMIQGKLINSHYYWTIVKDFQ
jgi:hypothetical protein